MMKSKITHIIFLLDRSGSMGGLEDDTIGGFNSLMKKQCELEGETRATVVLFDDEYEVIWDDADAREIRLTDKEYYVRGTTALLDAVGKTIHTHSKKLAEKQTDHVLFVITTDGMENASREYTFPQVKKMIQQQQEAGWEFLFLGANIDAVEEASNIGIHMEDSFQFSATKDGIGAMYSMVHEKLAERRK